MLKLPGKVLPRFSLIFAMFSLAACGGGGGGSSDNGSDPVPDNGSDPVPVTVESVLKPGLFTSTINFDSGNPAEDARTLISPTGRYAIYSENSQAGAFGKLTFSSDDTFSDDSGIFVFLDQTDIWQSVNGSLNGDAINSEELIAIFAGDNAEPEVASDIVGTRVNEVSDLQVTLEDYDGIYTLQDNTTTVTITDGGVLEGADGNGCVISGTINIPDPAYNIFEGILTLTNCEDLNGVTSEQRNGEYPVVGLLVLFEEGAKRLLFAGTNGEVRSVFIGDN